MLLLLLLMFYYFIFASFFFLAHMIIIIFYTYVFQCSCLRRFKLHLRNIQGPLEDELNEYIDIAIEIFA